MKKIMVGMICSRSTGKDTPIYREVTDEEHEEATQNWHNKFVDFFYYLVEEELKKKEKSHEN